MTPIPMPDTTLTSAELDELERLAKAATPGPWKAETNEKAANVTILGRSADKGRTRASDGHAYLLTVDCSDGIDDGAYAPMMAEHVANAAFIAFANPATILALLSLARAGLEAGKAEEWLPIETAPRDGTKLLLGRFTNGKAEIDHNGFMAVDHWRSPPRHDFTGWGKFNSQYWPATHWRPLPAPPAIRALPLTGGDNGSQQS